MTPAPYPADTRAKGWRFELDYERIRQSDTWALASPELRPWLLMLWMVAWEQTPCGSLPDDDALIAARIGMPSRAFEKARAVLMRGWNRADDGRLYHGTMTARVLEMLDYRHKNAKRVADYKAKMREQQSGNALPPRESPAKNDTGTGTGTGTNTPQDKPVVERGKRASRKCPLPFLVTAEMRAWAASNTPAVNVEAETEKFLDHTFKNAISDWPGAWRNWMRKATDFAPRKPATESFAQRAARERVESAVPGIAARPAAPVMEIFDVTARRLG